MVHFKWHMSMLDAHGVVFPLSETFCNLNFHLKILYPNPTPQVNDGSSLLMFPNFVTMLYLKYESTGLVDDSSILCE